MLLTVGNDDVFSFKSGNKWLENHPKEALFFTNTEDVWNELKGTYNNEFKDLVYGQLPKDIDVLKTLLEVKQRLQNIKWNVKV